MLSHARLTENKHAQAANYVAEGRIKRADCKTLMPPLIVPQATVNQHFLKVYAVHYVRCFVLRRKAIVEQRPY